MYKYNPLYYKSYTTGLKFGVRRREHLLTASNHVYQEQPDDTVDWAFEAHKSELSVADLDKLSTMDEQRVKFGLEPAYASCTSIIRCITSRTLQG